MGAEIESARPPNTRIAAVAVVARLERSNQGDFTDSALVGAYQRWWVLLQLLQPHDPI
jgi:hypothetical protein